LDAEYLRRDLDEHVKAFLKIEPELRISITPREENLLKTAELSKDTAESAKKEIDILRTEVTRLQSLMEWQSFHLSLRDLDSMYDAAWLPSVDDVERRKQLEHTLEYALMMQKEFGEKRPKWQTYCGQEYVDERANELAAVIEHCRDDLSFRKPRLPSVMRALVNPKNSTQKT
jgi:hypothetical protein